jgi:transposase-like protein
MTTGEGKSELIDVKDLLGRDQDLSERRWRRCFRRRREWGTDRDAAVVPQRSFTAVRGVSTHKVKAVTEVMCGHSFSTSAISAVNKSLDETLHKFAERRLDEPFPYLILDARYEKGGGIISSQAVLIAVAVDGKGPRQVLAVELANRESRSRWRDFQSRLKQRGLFGVEFVLSDDYEGL